MLAAAIARRPGPNAIALVTNHSNDFAVSDQAAGARAMATGVK